MNFLTHHNGKDETSCPQLVFQVVERFTHHDIPWSWKNIKFSFNEKYRQNLIQQKFVFLRFLIFADGLFQIKKKYFFFMKCSSLAPKKAK